MLPGTRRSRRGGAVLCALLMLGGCAGVEPWVQPYERDLLADAIMSFERDPMTASYRRHVFGVREGARGAAGGSGGGCGCN